MRFTEVHGRKVLDTGSATTVAKVDALLVDPAQRTVVALTVKRKGDQDVLRWSALSSFGPDAVTVEGEQVFTSKDEQLRVLAAKGGALLKKRVLLESGDEAGTVRDVDFDAASGAVLTLLTSEGDVDGSRLLGVGPYAVVVARA